MNKQRRNIGILAHVDAGKTTLTERILFYTGKKNIIGEVHEGKATTDYLKQEQERGITIQSASVTCDWKNSKINIIDTPGHIDFSGEVERALRVLDSIVLTLCSVAGIQPQTKTIWQKVRQKKISSLIYINKLDRKGAKFFDLINSLQNTFGNNELSFFPFILPIGIGEEYCGFYNLITQKAFLFSDNIKVHNNDNYIPISRENVPTIFNLEQADEYRCMLMLKCGLPFESDDVNLIIKKIRELVLDDKIIPVVCGSALKNKGVVELLDSIVDFLPSPEDLKTVEVEKSGVKTELSVSESKCATCLIVKVFSHKYGVLYVVRIYTGLIKKGQFIYNTSTNTKEKISRIVSLHADTQTDIEYAVGGDIVGIIGLKNGLPGETLSDDSEIVLPNIKFSDPVVSQAIIPKSKNDIEKLVEVLKKMCIEDQTFTYTIDSETKQLLINGIGPLHLEVKINDLRDIYNLEIETKTPEVRYKETITTTQPIIGNYFLKKQTGGRGQYANVTLEISKYDEGDFLFEERLEGNEMERNYIISVENGVKNVMKNGVIAGFPLIGIKCVLLDGVSHSVDSSDLAFYLAAQSAFSEAVLKAKPILLEPIAKVVVETPEEYLSKVIGDLNGYTKRGQILDILDGPNHNIKFIEALVPRSNLFNYDGDLRSLSSGLAKCVSMESFDFRPLPSFIEKEVINARRTLGKGYHSKSKNDER